MKGDHRRELKTNALADFLGRFIQDLKEGRNTTSTIVWVFVLLAMGIFAAWWHVSSDTYSSRSLLWTRFDSATDTSDYEGVAGDRGTIAGKYARFQVARSSLEKGLQDIYNESQASLPRDNRKRSSKTDFSEAKAKELKEEVDNGLREAQNQPDATKTLEVLRRILSKVETNENDAISDFQWETLMRTIRHQIRMAQVQSRLEQARDQYAMLVEECPQPPLLHQEALIGAARAEEALFAIPVGKDFTRHRGDFDRLLGYLHRLADQKTNTFLVEQAKKRVQDLEDPAKRAEFDKVYADFRKQLAATPQRSVFNPHEGLDRP